MLFKTLEKTYLLRHQCRQGTVSIQKWLLNNTEFLRLSNGPCQSILMEPNPSYKQLQIPRSVLCCCFLGKKTHFIAEFHITKLDNLGPFQRRLTLSYSQNNTISRIELAKRLHKTDSTQNGASVSQVKKLQHAYIPQPDEKLLQQAWYRQT